jgi:hypothetical protein
MILFSNLFCNQICLNIPMDDHHVGYITKLIEKTLVVIQKSYKSDIYYYNHAFNAII